MEETKRRVKKAVLIIGGAIIIFVVITVWISGITSHFDESNTYVYEGALSYVDRYNTRELRWGGLYLLQTVFHRWAKVCNQSQRCGRFAGRCGKERTEVAA